MDEAEYQAGLERLRADWGSLSMRPGTAGVLVAEKDDSAGILVGMRAPIIAEIINRALRDG